MDAPTPAADTGWHFDGRAGPFFGLALGNLLLTIVTFGIFRFWGKTRVRRYLWSHSHFAGEALEYRGRGLEKLIGALLALLLFTLPATILAVVVQVMTRSVPVLGIMLALAIYPVLIWVLGFALYRSRRYMVSRTAWRGIRGGMAGNGVAYAGRFLKLTLLQIITFGLATPFVTTRLWNAMMNDVRFGSLNVSAAAGWRHLQGKFLLPWGIMIVGYAALIAYVAVQGIAAGPRPPADPAAQLAFLGPIYLGLIAIAIAAGLATLSYTAALQRELWGHVRIGPLATTIDISGGALLMFWLGNAALIVFTLGLGTIMLPYRIFSFSARRIRITGVLDSAAMLQTDLAGPSHGDGLADAFDVTAF